MIATYQGRHIFITGDENTNRPVLIRLVEGDSDREMPGIYLGRTKVRWDAEELRELMPEGHKFPEFALDLMSTTPALKLDTGRVVLGFECWWRLVPPALSGPTCSHVQGEE